MWGWQEAAMRRTASVILGTTALITSAIAVPAQAALSAPAGSVIYGTVLAAGHPVAGAEVTLYAWPDQKVTAAMKAGQQVPLVAVGQAVSSSTGSYGVAVSDYAALRARADHGIVNLVATAVSGRTAGTFSFSRRLVAGGTELAADTNAAVPSTAPQTASLNLADGPSAPGVQCGMWHLLRTYPPTNVVVGATFSRVSYERTNFFYGVGQNSSIGVGVGNGNGTFHVSGTQISAEIGINLSARTGYSTTADLYYNQVHAHYLCGTNDYVGGTPKRIVAGLPA
jgi:hypothetical protein